MNFVGYYNLSSAPQLAEESFLPLLVRCCIFVFCDCSILCHQCIGDIISKSKNVYWYFRFICFVISKAWNNRILRCGVLAQYHDSDSVFTKLNGSAGHENSMFGLYSFFENWPLGYFSVFSVRPCGITRLLPCISLFYCLFIAP